ncbi:PAS domain S-box-containing protein/diguanylate cyclase (GGDEF) domain-containing protein [Kushneria avicenniae]|uniref:PAS domain S-box-containing protein/diguanylate cyclase (GGDEF) domain-containing protein n=1 Tax=Kushneria avicenniae TaxID=402385 RepID=A0A1I1JER8_9GAMM|nr:EAL domain-containing protein [Kushneria avicenniae]SFC47079.1 PAS domain S-box-containing protein/diguanylate cyclase (GGDEF) domain-containing protein [Kushneria avicenniae]
MNFSLKWRAIILTSLVMVGLASTFTLVSYRNLSEQFRTSQSASYRSRIEDINMSLERSFDDLRQIAGIVASSNSLGSALENGNYTFIDQALRSQWPTLQIEVGIESLSVLNMKGRNVSTFGDLQSDVPVALMRKWERSVIRDEMPAKTLMCTDVCRQYVAVPVLEDGRSVGIVVLTSSLIDVILYTNKSSGGDVALLIQGEVFADHTHYLPDWQSSIIALTNEKEELPVVREAVRSNSLASISQSSARLKHDGHNYEIFAMPLKSFQGSGGVSHLLLISDITSQVSEIVENTRDTFIIAVSGWLVAEILLFMILWRPMARLRHLSSVLPSLAHGGFDRVRRKTQIKNKKWKDEIDVLDNAAFDLADQLEQLENKVSMRDLELSARLKELARERDFIGGLLDNAHVLILTHDREGNITLVNRHAQEVMGNDQDLIGCSFEKIFNLDMRLAITLSGNTRQQESTVKKGNGEDISVTWVHAPLDPASEGEDHISVGLDITARKQAEKRLAWLANRDPLTELYNRRFFESQLKDAMHDCSNSGAVLYLDLDQFKNVNELGGHHSGDQLLKLVAQALIEELGEKAIVARQGGGEFSILLEKATAADACQMASRISRKLENIVFCENGRRHRAMASIGIALYPDHGADHIKLMANADFAMYKAKDLNSNKWYLIPDEYDTSHELQERVYWMDEIRRALSEKRFELAVQPIACVEHGTIQHYEVLLRMRDENGNLAMPGLFIPAAERSGLIVEVDRWVLCESLDLLVRLQERPITLAVNISGTTLQDENFSDFVEQALKVRQLDPERLILEVTETAAVTDFSAANNLLKGVQALGCKIALDDFGVGFSSFHYLGQMPSDYIKIDGSFVSEMLKSSENRLVVKAIADVARGFGKKVVAEFVSDAQILEALKGLNVDYAQGYYVGLPIRPEEAFNFEG